jgi:hypothetical protein
MRLLKNKKGNIWPVIIGFVVFLVLGGILLKIIYAGTKLAHQGANATINFGLAGGDAPSTFLFESKSLNISEDNLGKECKSFTDTKTNTIQYRCEPNKDIYFETQIYNGGSAQRRFYGGIVVCELKCSRGGSKCEVIDTSCNNRIIDSQSSDTCTIRIGETDACAAGFVAFKENTNYAVYPVATCQLDATYGCSQVGMTSPERRRNILASIRITTIPEKAS